MKEGKIINVIILILASLCMLFGNGRWFIGIMTWIYPILMLRYSRSQKPLKGFIIISIVSGIVSQIAFLNFASNDPSAILYYLPAMLGPVFAIPYLIDRLYKDRVKGILSTLVFPFTYVIIEFVYAHNPFGSTGILGYTQFNALIISQLASITGVWGITFLITWTAAIINGVNDSIRNNNKLFWKKVFSVYIIVMLAVVVFGSIRILLPNQMEYVKVTGLHVYDIRGEEGKELWAAKKNDLDKFREMSGSIQDRLFNKTINEAKAGADIIVWNEVAPPVYIEDENDFMERAAATAKDQEIYLVTSPYVVHNSPIEKDENKLLIFNPDGEVVLTHYKYGGNIFEGSVPGDKVLRVSDTEYGRISGIICWDQDFPWTVRQAGEKQVDILFAPTADWKEITPIHTTVGYYRGVENGCSLIRQGINGLSIITDPKGRILASMNHYKTDEWVMHAQVPIKGVNTIYSFVGDAFVWFCIIGLAYIIISVVWRGKIKRR